MRHGNTDYDDGLFPDIPLNEDYTNLGILGDINEPLLAAAINNLYSFKQPQQRNNFEFNELSNSKIVSPIYQKMVK
jgi:hypothetical protein